MRICPGSLSLPRIARARLSGVISGIALLASALSPATGTEICPEDYAPAGRVKAAGATGDITLEDGRIIRLAGIAFHTGEAGTTDPPTHAMSFLSGRDLDITRATPDRHGRLEAMARLHESEQSVQEFLLGKGLAIARPQAGWLGCMPALLAAEREARTARRGLWASTLPLTTTDEAAIRDQLGRFTIMEGRVLTVGKRRAVDYLNFGRIWRQDTTVRLENTAREALKARGIDPAGFAGRTVTVRGTVLEAGGPAMNVRWIEQIEWYEEEPGTRPRD